MSNGASAEQPTIAGFAEAIRANVVHVIIGKDSVVEQLLVALLAGGHVLLQDVPGTGKTILARALAISLGVEFRRIQCTPDLLPNDIAGVSVYNQGSGEFQFRPGPLFANVLLADEINRATPRTQSALLEAMAERQVTVDGATYPLGEPFLVLATENPIEFEGTFPLPEAQLDRFLMQLSVGYPTLSDEARMIRLIGGEHPITQLRPVISPGVLPVLQQQLDTIHLSDALVGYILRLITATRQHFDLLLGGSPRATLALCRASQAAAALKGRTFVVPDDVKALAEVILTHRLVLKPESALRGRTATAVMREIVGATPVDVADEVTA